MKNGAAKKAVSLLLSAAVLAPAFGAGAANIKTDRVVRDPCVVLVDDTYYMYGTGLAGAGYGCVTSDDLVNWSSPTTVFSPSEGFDGYADFWAPECHYYNGSYYLFATYRSSATQKRGVGIFRSESPLGPFDMISDGHITPKDHDAIDGTLYVDEEGRPWMVFVSEWTSNEDEIGDMAAARMSEDLTHFISEPIILFRAKAPVWAKGKITDGPWLYKTSEGRLLMLWSNSDRNGYCVGIAYSSNGKIDGKWHQQPKTLYSGGGSHVNDGGHGMLFTDKNGQLTLSIHSPNGSSEGNPTTALFLDIDDIGDTVILKEKSEPFYIFGLKLYYALADFFNPVFDKIASFFSGK